MTDLKQTAERISTERLEEMLAGLEGVTSGPWQVIEEKHEWSLPERAMMGHDIPAQAGEHLERRIFTTWEHPQAKSPWPIVNSSIGIGKAGEPSVQMVWIDPADAAHIARCDPDTMRSILTELLASRHADAQPEAAEWQVEAAEWLDEAAGYFDRRPTDGEDMAFWANVTNAKFCRGLAARLRAASLPAPERSKEEMGVRVKPLVDYLWQEMCELPDRSSPEDYPDHALVTLPELTAIVETWAEMSALETPPLHKEGEAVATINAQGGVLMTEAGEEWFKALRNMKAPLGHVAAYLYAAPVPVPVTITDGWPEAPEGWQRAKPTYVRRDGALRVEFIYGREATPWRVAASLGNGANATISYHATLQDALTAALSVNPQSGSDKP